MKKSKERKEEARRKIFRKASADLEALTLQMLKENEQKLQLIRRVNG